MRENEKAFLKLVDKGVFKICKNGNIYRCKRKIRFKDGYKDCKLRLIKAKVNGYMHIEFNYNRKLIYILIHRAIWLYFNGEIPESLELNHKNLIKNDNRLSNLELMTSIENVQHAFKAGFVKSAKGENHGSHKLTEKKVLRIRKLLKQGMLQEKIAKIFNVHYSAISLINTKRTWSWL